MSWQQGVKTLFSLVLHLSGACVTAWCACGVNWRFLKPVSWLVALKKKTLLPELHQREDAFVSSSDPVHTNHYCLRKDSRTEDHIKKDLPLIWLSKVVCFLQPSTMMEFDLV